MSLAENRSVLWGIGMIAVGFVLSVTSLAGSDPSNSIIVMTGLLLAGTISLIRGLYQHFKHAPRPRRH